MAGSHSERASPSNKSPSDVLHQRDLSVEHRSVEIGRSVPEGKQATR